MRVLSLQVRDLRNLVAVDLEPGPGLNLFQGPNGAGKTALLEGIHLLARGRSFRTSRLSEIVRHGQPAFQVTARISHGRDGELTTGVARQGGELQIRYGGQAVGQVSAHARRFPLAVSTPASQELVHGSPKVRRKWLDWGLFHVEQDYLRDWRDYHRALRQRNVLLKSAGSSRQLDAFEYEMAEYAARIDVVRRSFIDRLSMAVSSLAPKVMEPPITLALDSGWQAERPLADQLAEGRSRDRETGQSKLGPHRADLVIQGLGRDAAAALSRGQTKMLVVILTLALAQVVHEQGGETPVLLLDDPFAELDLATQQRLLAHLQDLGCQALVTLTDAGGHLLRRGEACLFHVERGAFRKMLE